MDYDEIIQSIRNDNIIQKYENLKNVSNEEEKYKLSNIIFYLKNCDNEKIENMNTNNNLNELDNIIFRRPWKNLYEIHKKMKITEFLDDTNCSNILKMKKILINNLENKKLNKKNSVIYDSINGKILAINGLSIDHDKNMLIYK